MQTGTIFNIQRYSLHDGPGIRTTVFLKGCPLRCRWCHNPEGLTAEPEIVFVPRRCIGCGLCREASVEACPTEARRVVGRQMTVDDLLAEILRDQIFYDDSSGGVTFSGGEPLGQASFLADVLAACRARGIHTVVDTCGYALQEDLLGVAPLVDLFLYDLKTLDDRRHRQYTGVSNGLILDNLRALGPMHGNIWVRIPILPGWNDGPDELEAMVGFAAAVPGVRQVNLLPYHATAADKAARLGREFEAAGLVPPSPAAMGELALRLQTIGIPVINGG